MDRTVYILHGDQTHDGLMEGTVPVLQLSTQLFC
jgi:hypothetical protein